MKEKEKQKEAYILPELKVYDVKSEGVICGSGVGEDITWGGGYDSLII